MKIFAAILALLTTSTAIAQVPPSCRPGKLADVHLVSAGADFAGWWWCDASKATYTWRGILRPAITADLTSLAYAWAVTGDARIFDQVVTMQETDPKFAALKAAVAAAVAASKPQFVVAKNGVYQDRPEYTLIDGVRGTASMGRIAVGATCDCSLSLMEGTTRYCRVSQPFLVAVCVPK